MSYATRIRISMLDNSSWDITVRPEKLKQVKGLPSGTVFTLERQTGDVQKEQVLIRPYYRRFIDDELHIFAVQVKPAEEAHHGK